ncbi:cysteine-rich CWC family protein [Marinomonas fungiae]|uniref:cysteine-rich CWC family protein n=1 Tax=Marinomonas fungiae TaxID=1137284 RepID=UPI003A90EFFE
MSAEIMSSIDSTRCPLCGENNQCAVTLGQDPSTCWCHQPDIVIDKVLLSKIPSVAQGKACICKQCVALAAQSRQGEQANLNGLSSDAHLDSFFDTLKKS